MTTSPWNPTRKFWNTLSSVKTGIFLLIAVVLASVAGTLVLQRPVTDPAKMQMAYSPATLRWLDAIGLTDVFHAWWFAGLLALLGVNIVLASLERFPAVWRFFSRPYRRPESHFLAGLPLQKEIPVRDAGDGMLAAEFAFREMGFKPQRIGKGRDASLYVEKNRFSRLAAYVVHLSLLLIFAGGIVDAVWGYRGFIALGQHDQTNEVELQSGVRKSLPFSIRCVEAGRENYADGTPRQWWSKLVVLQDGREVKSKRIDVNDPLVFAGVRFFQSSYGSTGEVSTLTLSATPKQGGGSPKVFELRPGVPAELDAQTTVSLAAFVPDFVLNGNQIESRSDQPNNPAVQLSVDSKATGTTKVWIFPRFPEFAHPDKSPYTFKVQDLQMGYFTGLQVAHEPGQWAVWAGVLLMGLGLVMAFYFVHVRYWVVPIIDARGNQILWVGASASKNRDDFNERFKKLVGNIEASLKVETEAPDTRVNASLVSA